MGPKLVMIRNYQLLSLIVPMYNEEEALDSFFDTTLPILRSLHNNFEIVCVNDGSSDNTLKNLLLKQILVPEIIIIDFHKNFGKEAATTAGIEQSQGDIIIPIDADLQDPPHIIPKMVEKWQNGYDEVLAIRASRESDTSVKRNSSGAFYRIFNKFAEQKIPNNAGDFRLMDKSIADIAIQLPEKNRFMKGIFSWASNGNTAVVEYTRDAREFGLSKWNYWKLWNFAIDGITAFSSWPLRVWSYVGVGVSSIAVIFMFYTILKHLIFHSDLPGYASLMCVILFLGGIQLISLGIIGEYISRIYNESKNRPLYIIKKIHRSPNNI
ncbi:MAG: glycosyltransferase involved in cell wall biosynthesis [Francisellaceae bacterium]|jgi:glycosyltransferase involved in cell wall biosynthesis